MNINTHQRQAQRTIPKYWTADQGRTHALFGMTGELGELTDLFKKAWFQGHSLNMADVQVELADMLWHWFEMCTFCGWQASDVADVLEAKLQKRYPGNGFTPEDSIARVDQNGD